MGEARRRKLAGEYPDTTKPTYQELSITISDDQEMIASSIVSSLQEGNGAILKTKKGYGRAHYLAISVSDECARNGINLPPCEIPIAINPVNKDGIFYSWMPERYKNASECNMAPVLIIIEECYRYVGIDSNGNHIMEKLEG